MGFHKYMEPENNKKEKTEQNKTNFKAFFDLALCKTIPST
jgi:hypothetical protein